MSETQVICLKKDYDELVKFKKDIESNKIVLNHRESSGMGFYSTMHYYEYSALPSIIDEISIIEKNVADQRINEINEKYKALLDTKRSIIDILKSIIEEERNKNKWWKIW